MKKGKSINNQFDEQIAKVLAKSIKAGQFKLEGIDRAIFMAGQLSPIPKKSQ